MLAASGHSDAAGERRGALQSNLMASFARLDVPAIMEKARSAGPCMAGLTAGKHRRPALCMRTGRLSQPHLPAPPPQRHAGAGPASGLPATGRAAGGLRAGGLGGRVGGGGGGSERRRGHRARAVDGCETAVPAAMRPGPRTHSRSQPPPARRLRLTPCPSTAPPRLRPALCVSCRPRRAVPRGHLLLQPALAPAAQHRARGALRLQLLLLSLLIGRAGRAQVHGRRAPQSARPPPSPPPPPRPSLPQLRPGTIINCGVMYYNVRAWAATLPAMLSYADDEGWRVSHGARVTPGRGCRACGGCGGSKEGCAVRRASSCCLPSETSGCPPAVLLLPARPQTRSCCSTFSTRPRRPAGGSPGTS